MGRVGCKDGDWALAWGQGRLDKVRRERVADIERMRREQEEWEAREEREREMERLRALEQVGAGQSGAAADSCSVCVPPGLGSRR